MLGEPEKWKEAPDQESGTCTATEQTHHPTTTKPRPESKDSRLRVCNDIATNMDIWVTECTSASYRPGVLHDNATVDDHTRELFLVVYLRTASRTK